MSIDFPGFADPVLGAQTAFRAILAALSSPGSIFAAGTELTPPEPLSRAAAAALLTLVDADTPVWLAPAFAAARDWISFHCGAPITGDLCAAQFVLTDSLPPLESLNAGSDEGPEESATVILQVPGLIGGGPMTLAGPGLRRPEVISFDGLPENFADIWRTNHALYPRGVDLMLCASDRLAALPRGISVTES